VGGAEAVVGDLGAEVMHVVEAGIADHQASVRGSRRYELP
jgi:hypothetical protein